MIKIRHFNRDDTVQVGQVIADTYSAFNLSFAPADEIGAFLGPFRHARSTETAHQEAIAQAIQTEMVFVAEHEGEIVGVLRGRKERLQSLFVRGDRHRQGIGRKLIGHLAVFLTHAQFIHYKRVQNNCKIIKRLTGKNNW